MTTDDRYLVHDTVLTLSHHLPPGKAHPELVGIVGIVTGTPTSSYLPPGRSVIPLRMGLPLPQPTLGRLVVPQAMDEMK